MPNNFVASTSLPVPGEAAISHSKRLAAVIRDEIENAGGAIGFDRYMDLALYAPGLGYYAAGSSKFGEAGDFVTAPEISPWFSRCVARQVAEVLEGLDGGDVIEVGAGRATLAGELMRSLLESGVAPARYLILETSADLRARQRIFLEKNFPDCLSYFQWIDTFPCAGLCGVLLANEVLDAFPASRFQILNDTVTELCVGWDAGNFTWTTRTPGVHLERAIGNVLASLPEALPSGYKSELSLVRCGWIGEMLNRMNTGVALLFDYGYQQREYYHPQRINGTLSCHYRHRMHDNPLILTGLQDISTHVDFSAVAHSAREAGAEVLGYTTQANFLFSTGLIEQVGTMFPGTREHAELTGQIKRLTLPGEMGELVKVLALARGVDQPLIGFRERDLSGQL